MLRGIQWRSNYGSEGPWFSCKLRAIKPCLGDYSRQCGQGFSCEGLNFAEGLKLEARRAECGGGVLGLEQLVRPYQVESLPGKRSELQIWVWTLGQSPSRRPLSVLMLFEHYYIVELRCDARMPDSLCRPPAQGHRGSGVGTPSC